ncbi:MAG: hypothetical protein H7Z41_15890, partial [Cytophagales bacterium]|nr:hypothetical protein [Armatimonadota bacterium]
MAFLRRRAPRSPLSLAQRLLALTVFLVPPSVLCVWGASAFIRQIDGALAQAAPLASAEVSRSLRREVRIGRLESDLTSGGILALIRRRSQFGTVPVIASDVSVANGTTIAGSGLVASARRVTVDLNIPLLLGGQTASGGVPRVTVTDPFLLLERFRDGSFNVTKLLPKKDPNQPPSPPFRTYVALENGRVRFQDFQTRIATPSAPAVNSVQNLNGFADLSGAREFRFVASARAQRGTPTAQRLTGLLKVDGSLGRGLPSVRPDAPSKESARYLIHFAATGAAARYWLPYFVALPAIRITSGTADVDATLAAPRPPSPGTPNPRLGIAIGARFRNGRIEAEALPVPLTDAVGRLAFSEGALDYDAAGRVLGEPVSSSGTLWNLTAPELSAATRVRKEVPKPQLAVTLRADRVPLERSLATFLPKGVRVPSGLRVSGAAAITAAFNGSLGQPVITAIASLPSGQIAYQDFPPLSRIAANLTYTQGLLGVTNATAQIAGGGTVRGRLGLRLAPSTSGGEAERGNSVFAARVENVPLPRLAALRRLVPIGNRAQPLRLAGSGSVDLTGKRVRGQFSAAANVRTNGLALGSLSFPVASARVIYDKGVVSLPWARVLSPSGAATVRGGVGTGGALSLRFALSSLDLRGLASALGLSGIGGTLTASGTVEGTTAAPRVLVERAVALNLKYQIGATPAENGQVASPPRTLALDTVTARNLVLTRSDLVIADPLLLRRYPAVVAVSGRISDLLPSNSASGRGGPRLALTARISNLDYAEVLRQLGVEPPISITPGQTNSAAIDSIFTRSAPRPLVIPTQPRSRGPFRSIASAAANATSRAGAAFSGFVNESTVRVTGPIRSPSISGAAQLGRLLIGPYPVDGGYVRFAFGPDGSSLPEIRLRASVGVITASASLDKNGKIQGTFRAPNLRLAPLSFLTEGVVGVSGDLSVAGTLAGDLQNAVVQAQVFPSTVEIAGTSLTGVAADSIVVRYRAASKTSDLSVPKLSFVQGGTQVSANAVRYNFSNGRFAGDLRVQTGDIGVLLDTVRRSGLADTPAGAGIVRSLNALPYPVSGTFVLNRLAVSGRIANGLFTERSVTADLQARNL